MSDYMRNTWRRQKLILLFPMNDFKNDDDEAIIGFRVFNSFPLTPHSLAHTMAQRRTRRRRRISTPTSDSLPRKTFSNDLTT